MSVELEYRVRRGLGAVLGQVGTRAVGRALLLLVAIFVSGELAWGALGSEETAAALGASWAYRALAAALILDAAVALLRAVPLERGAGGAHALRRPSLAEWGTLALRASAVLVGSALLASTLARDVLILRVAEGEALSASPDQVVGRAPARPLSAGPFATALVVQRVDGDVGLDGTTRGLAVEVAEAGETWRASPWRPLWFGFGRLLRPVRAGVTLRYSIALADGRLIDSAFAKLDLLPAGRRVSLRSPQVPHRFLVSLSGAGALAERRPSMEVMVSREKMVVARAIVAPDGVLEFEGLRLRVPEWRRWVEFRMVRDPGLGLAAVAGVVWLVGVSLGRLGRSGAARPRGKGEAGREDSS
jgi:hypothetical protein